MKTQYIVNGWFKAVSEDNIEEGELSDGKSFDQTGTDRFEANSIDDLINQVMNFAGVTDKDAVELDACEELGRIDIQKQENAEGYDPSPQEWADFRANKINLYSVCYIFHVERHSVSTPSTVTTSQSL